jgi:hypothetical protein
VGTIRSSQYHQFFMTLTFQQHTTDATTRDATDSIPATVDTTDTVSHIRSLIFRNKGMISCRPEPIPSKQWTSSLKMEYKYQARNVRFRCGRLREMSPCGVSARCGSITEYRWARRPCCRVEARGSLAVLHVRTPLPDQIRT